jgi:hypothetical protein
MPIFIPIDTAGSSINVDTNFSLLFLFFLIAKSVFVSVSERVVHRLCALAHKF